MSRIHASPDTTFTQQSTVVPLPVYGRSVFQPHALQPASPPVVQERSIQPDWMMALLLFCFILLAWARFFYAKRIQQIFLAPFSKRFINQLTRDGNLFGERIAIAMGSVYLVTMALFLYICNDRLSMLSLYGISGFSLFLLIAAFILALLSAKVTLILFLGSIFKTREATNNYLLNQLIFALLTGPVLLAALVLIIYLKSIMVLYICMVILLLLMVLRIFRGLFIGMALRKFSYLFLFVYLCSLEILPLLILVKVILLISHPAGA